MEKIIICRGMSSTQLDFSLQEEEEEESEEIELKLGLSIGGVYQNLNPAVKDTSNSNEEEEENPSRSIGGSMSFDGDEMDPDTKREIHAARRKEAKRKRQEKRQKVDNRRNKTGDEYDNGDSRRDMNENSIVYVESRMYQIPPLPNGFGSSHMNGDGEAPQVDNAVRRDPNQSLSRCSSSTGSENLSSRSHSNVSYPDQHHTKKQLRDDDIDQKQLANAAEFMSSRKRKGKSISSKNTIMLTCEEETNLNKGKPPKPQTTKPNINNGSLPYMPCVSTTGKGPNGKTINGFLYKYAKSEEVTIVCVCHGKTFSPAEFVQHAGGVDLSHPLKHINVIPSAF